MWRRVQGGKIGRVIKTNFPPLRMEGIICPHCECGRRIGIHSRQERRYKCHDCGRIFAETVGTPLYGLKYPLWMVTLLSYGFPVQAASGYEKSLG